jgi:ATP-dependent RNA helicase SUPV3L1/SUV3
MLWIVVQLLILYHMYTSIKLFAILDDRHPQMWYPKAREKKRNVFLHVGPTNSGKTYSALKRLEESSSGTQKYISLYTS